MPCQTLEVSHFMRAIMHIQMKPRPRTLQKFYTNINIERQNIEVARERGDERKMRAWVEPLSVGLCVMPGHLQCKESFQSEYGQWLEINVHIWSSWAHMHISPILNIWAVSGCMRENNPFAACAYYRQSLKKCLGYLNVLFYNCYNTWYEELNDDIKV